MPSTSTAMSAQRTWPRRMTSIGSRAEQVAALCGAAVYDDPLWLIQDDRIEAVIIASPDATHAGFVQECLRCGKPVPARSRWATSAADAARVIEVECALGRRLVSVG